jgi:redox-sensitive bicupin YhaK (pirin superfamily)
MEIISYMVMGSMKHRDSSGSEDVLKVLTGIKLA